MAPESTARAAGAQPRPASRLLACAAQSRDRPARAARSPRGAAAADARISRFLGGRAVPPLAPAGQAGVLARRHPQAAGAVVPAAHLESPLPVSLPAGSSI